MVYTKGLYHDDFYTQVAKAAGWRLLAICGAVYGGVH